MDCSPPGSSVHEISRHEHWSWLLFPSPGDLPDPGIEPWSPALQADSLQSEPPGKPILSCFHLFSNCAELLRDILLRQEKTAQVGQIKH